MWMMLKGSIGQSEAGMLAIASRLMMMFAEIFSVCVASLVLGTKRVPSQNTAAGIAEPPAAKEAKPALQPSIAQRSSLAEAEG